MGKTSIAVFILTFFIFSLLVNASFTQEKKKKKMKMKKLSFVAERQYPEIKTLIPFIDAHVHLNDINMQLGLMKTFQISQSVVFWGRSSTNETLLKAANKYPDKFIPFVSVSPERKKYRILWENNDPRLLYLLDEQLKTGLFKGIGELSVSHFPGFGFPESNFSPTSQLMKGIMRLAEKYNVPVNVHSEITRIEEFSKLLIEFKNVNVIWAHGGYTPYFLAQRMINNHPNLTYELSARTWLNHPRSSDYTIFKSDTKIWNQWLRLIEENPKRFLVGTDSSNHSSRRDARKIESVNLFLEQLSPETRARVARTNLLELLR